jgi:hexosaminidase
MVGTDLGNINSVNGRLQDIKDGYSLIRDLYQQSWLRTDRPYALRPVLEHYDNTIGLWLDRIDKVRTAQRMYSNDKPLPAAADLGIPAPPVTQ